MNQSWFKINSLVVILASICANAKILEDSSSETFKSESLNILIAISNLIS